MFDKNTADLLKELSNSLNEKGRGIFGIGALGFTAIVVWGKVLIEAYLDIKDIEKDEEVE